MEFSGILKIRACSGLDTMVLNYLQKELGFGKQFCTSQITRCFKTVKLRRKKIEFSGILKI